MKISNVIFLLFIMIFSSMPVMAQMTKGNINKTFELDGSRVSLNISTDGSGIKLSPDGRGVTLLADDSHIDVTIRSGRSSNRISYRNDNGQIERKFWINGNRQDWNAEAENFVLQVMPILFRETGISTEARVQWLLNNAGPTGLLNEIELIRSDSVQKRYSLYYAESGTISEQNFIRLMLLTGNQIGSDSQLSKTLTAINETQQPINKNLTALLNAGRSIGSDSQAASLLIALANTLPSSEEAFTAYLNLAQGIGSDSQLHRALLAVITRPDLSDGDISKLIEFASKHIGSDSELSRLLSSAAIRVGNSDLLAKSYTDATQSIGSDSNSKKALLALAEQATLSPIGWQRLLQSTHHIGSDSQAAGLLVNITGLLPNDKETLTAFRNALQTIGSNSEYRRTNDAFVQAFIIEK